MALGVRKRCQEPFPFPLEDDPDVYLPLFDYFEDDNDADIHLTYSVQSNTNPGLFSGVDIEPATGQMRLGFAPNDFGTADITLVVTDTEGASVESTFTVTVAPVNDLPIASDDYYLTAPGETLFAGGADPENPEGVLFNDHDPDVFNGISYGSGPPDVLSATLVSGVLNGTLVFHADGSFEYTAAPGFSGMDSFSYEVNDGSVVSNIATVQISVSSTPNGPPVAVDDEFDVGVDPVIGSVLPNDFDPDDDPLEAILVSGPTEGELLLNSDGSFTYTPEVSEDALDDVFAYQVTDGLETSNVAVVQCNRSQAGKGRKTDLALNVII